MTVIAFLVYHTRQGRTRFVDQLFVDAKHRRKGHATKLLDLLTTGPIELIVRRNNTSALAAYLALGFCLGKVPERGFHPDNDEFYMRTVSFTKAKKLIKESLKSKPPPKTVTTKYQTWRDVPADVKKYMIDAVKASEKLNTRKEAENVVHPGASAQYVILT